jgi:hypothetical protein
MRLYHLLLCCVVLLSAACHTNRPIVDPSPGQSAGGTIAGIVTTADRAIAVPGRKVTATEINKGSHYESTTAANGGYTIKVPEGTYRIEIELRGSETLAKRPDETRINNGDTDSGRDFVITAK